MKGLCYLLACTLAFTACNNQAPKETAATIAVTSQASPEKAPVMTFEENVHNFGDIAQGEKVEYAFKFTNTGKSDLIINEAVSSCGCTVPEWPKAPVKPGETGYMKVVFDSKGKAGYTEKEIMVKANTVPDMINGPKIQCNVIVPQGNN